MLYFCNFTINSGKLYEAVNYFNWFPIPPNPYRVIMPDIF